MQILSRLGKRYYPELFVASIQTGRGKKRNFGGVLTLSFRRSQLERHIGGDQNIDQNLDAGGISHQHAIFSGLAVLLDTQRAGAKPRVSRFRLFGIHQVVEKNAAKFGVHLPVGI